MVKSERGMSSIGGIGTRERMAGTLVCHGEGNPASHTDCLEGAPTTPVTPSLFIVYPSQDITPPTLISHLSGAL